MVMGRPRVAEKMVKVDSALLEPEIASLDKLANRMGTSRAAVIRMLIRAALASQWPAKMRRRRQAASVRRQSGSRAAGCASLTRPPPEAMRLKRMGSGVRRVRFRTGAPQRARDGLAIASNLLAELIGKGGQARDIIAALGTFQKGIDQVAFEERLDALEAGQHSEFSPQENDEIEDDAPEDEDGNLDSRDPGS